MVDDVTSRREPVPPYGLQQIGPCGRERISRRRPDFHFESFHGGKCDAVIDHKIPDTLSKPLLLQQLPASTAR